MSEGSVPVVSRLIGMASDRVGTSLKEPVALDLTTGDGGEVRITIPRRHRLRWSSDGTQLEVRRADGGIFLSLSVHCGWDMGERRLTKVSASLRRMVRQKGAVEWRSRKRRTIPAMA